MERNRNMIPSFSRGKLENLKKAIEEGIVTAPAFHFLTDDDKKCLAFIDIDGTIYELGMNRIEELEEKMTVLNDSMGDLNNITDIIPPETGATNIVEYISSINEAVNNVTNTVKMLTSDSLGDDDNETNEEPNTEPSTEPTTPTEEPSGPVNPSENEDISEPTVPSEDNEEENTEGSSEENNPEKGD